MEDLGAKGDDEREREGEREQPEIPTCNIKERICACKGNVL